MVKYIIFSKRIWQTHYWRDIRIIYLNLKEYAVKILMDNILIMNGLLFYKEHKIKVIDFPPYLINPIENIWGKIKKEIMKKEFRLVYKRYLKGINITESQLLFCKYEWQNIELIYGSITKQFLLVLISLNLYLHLILNWVLVQSWMGLYEMLYLIYSFSKC